MSSTRSSDDRRMAANPPVRKLELERLLPAAPAVVFRAFSAPHELTRWWGPKGFVTPSLEFDPRVGASYRIQMQPPEGDPFHLTGEFREVYLPAHLAYTFSWEPPHPTNIQTWSNPPVSGPASIDRGRPDPEQGALQDGGAPGAPPARLGREPRQAPRAIHLAVFGRSPARAADSPLPVMNPRSG